MAVDNKLAVDIIKSVGRYWSDNEHSDCRITVDGKVFQASSFVLSACSEFFRQVFHTASITHKNIVIKGISADVFSCVIKALFTGVTGLDESNMVDVFLAAGYLKIDFLVQKCEQFIEEHLTKENYLQLCKGLFCVSSVTLTNKMVRLMALDFDEFRLTETFLNLPSVMVIKIVESGEVKSQDTLVESVLKWASHGPKDVIGTFGFQLYHDFQDLMDFCVPFDFNRYHLYQFVANDVTRSQILVQLIKKMNLGELSEAGLKMIYEDKLAIEHHDVKDAVMHEMATRMLYKSDNKSGRSLSKCTTSGQSK
ncbi:kelch-like protein 24a [Physella acuta]|uniref:kelch-like protein 24a n=1 Tax=Physella acuta TaxID=109671 RepID=UPI0027DDE55D|nr:kelch-like protein 24a [Physella acuta]